MFPNTMTNIRCLMISAYSFKQSTFPSYFYFFVFPMTRGREQGWPGAHYVDQQLVLQCPDISNFI